MLLGSLLQLIDKLRDRIDTYGGNLKDSEALTRYALIDPMLRELGWDTDDPSQVVPEYRVPNNQMADYVLLANGTPAIVVESKKLDEPLRGGKALDQGILYCAHTDSRYFLLTDGRRWELYEAGSTVPRMSFDLKDDPPAQSCLKALALLRPSVESGYVTAGNSPVAVQDNAHLTPDAIASPQTTPPDDHEWQPLSELNPAPKSAPPTAVRFPDNSTASTTAWNEMLVKTVRWLIDGKHLNTSDCPIQLPGSKRYIVADRPFHPEGKEFFASTQVGPLYVEKNLNLSHMVRATRFIVSRVGQDASRFRIRSSALPS